MMKKIKIIKNILEYCLVIIMFFPAADALAFQRDKETDRDQKLQELQERFEWWPSDALPAPVKDSERGGYWWWPEVPGKAAPWGNRGYIYVYKIIFDYKAEELPPAKPQEARPSLVIKKIIKNVKIYFDYDKADLREDHIPILENAVKILNNNTQADILITGNCDRRGSESYNLKLGECRAEAVREFMIKEGVSDKRTRIVSKGKLAAAAPITDLPGMQKDRNVQFMIAEVEEVYISPDDVSDMQAKPMGKGKFIVEDKEEIESQMKISTKEYVVKKGDSLSKIAKDELGAAHRWKYLYEFNKDRIKNCNNLKPGQKILIPIE